MEPIFFCRCIAVDNAHDEDMNRVQFGGARRFRFQNEQMKGHGLIDVFR